MDGDLSMGGEKKNFNPYQRPKRAVRSATSESLDHEGSVIIFVTGQTDMQSLVNDSGLHEFLCRKASPVKINITSKRSSETSGVVSFVVGDIIQARAIRKLTGIRYKGQKLTIKTSEDNKILGSTRDSAAPLPLRSGVPPSHGTIEAIRNFIRSRYNGGFLNLENMAQDSILRAAKVIPPGQAKGRSDVGTVIMKVAAEMFPETKTISFAMNGLKSLQPISAVAQFFPNLENLSLKGNDIQYYKDLEFLSGSKKLPKLRELILEGNPVRDRDIVKNKDDFAYRSSVTKLFPSIVILDGSPVAPKISFGLGDILKDADVPETALLPTPIKGNFMDSAVTESTVLEFLSSYLKLFDNNRSLLESAYDNSATFSFSTVTAPSLLQKNRGEHADNWGAYIPMSRNLTRIKDLDQRTKRMYYGSNDIIHQGLMKLPETKHDLSDASKFCIDAWQTGQLLPAVCIYINIHGEFEEVHHGSQGVLKSFDRSFIVAPAPPNSSAALNGWKCLIISDQLNVRGYNGSEAWKPDLGLNVQQGSLLALNGAVSQLAPAAAPSTPQVPMAGVSSEQHAKAQELQKLTGLNYPYAIQCLAASNWDIANGVALVNENRASIPQDAWQQPTFQ
ncbi:hypothetical protein EDD21DRAFT_371221 [Dissophora ornata]|nr:hypothetical protein EDD21DRAFT_371221 [Dissophora ornata]